MLGDFEASGCPNCGLTTVRPEGGILGDADHFGDPVAALARVREIILSLHSTKVEAMGETLIYTDAFYDEWLIPTVSGPFGSIPDMLEAHLKRAARPTPEESHEHE